MYSLSNSFKDEMNLFENSSTRFVREMRVNLGKKCKALERPFQNLQSAITMIKKSMNNYTVLITTEAMQWFKSSYTLNSGESHCYHVFNIKKFTAYLRTFM